MHGAVVTGDIVGFTLISSKNREKLITDVKTVLAAWEEQKGYAEIFRGDSFQLLFTDIGKAVRHAVQLRCLLMKWYFKNQETLIDARIAIGIGEISYIGKTVLDSDGEAFHLSGRMFDKLEEGRLKITTPQEELNKQLDIIIGLLDMIISGWTIAQAEVIYLLLQNKTQQQIADELKIAQSAVNNRIKLAKWKEVDKTLNYLVSVLENLK